ncbi:MAG: amino acid permease, partial [Gemmatimonadota bacterium]|nr:amino acid permease [Gemmatimonadota bacterium]
GALSDTAAPLARAGSAFGGPGAVALVSAGGIAAMLGVILSQLLGLSRMTFAMARRGDLPRGLAAVHPRHAVPHRAVLVVGLIAAVIAATGALERVVVAAAFTILVYYGIANLSALRLPVEARLYPRFVPWIGLLGCAALALSLDLITVIGGLAWIGAGLAVRRVVTR